MIAVFDTETRGLWGPIFKIGYLRNNQYFTFNNAKEFFQQLENDCKIFTAEPFHLYAFNLDFDIGKIIKELPKLSIDFDNSLLINGKFHSCKFFEIPIFFHDLYPLVNSSLAEAAKSFKLNSQKLELVDDEEKEEYFLSVSPDDEKLLEYLKNDCLATFELAQKLMELSGLTEKEFVRCPTLPAMAMKVFRKDSPAEYEKIKASALNKKTEEIIRQGYYGGRVEVFKPILAGDAYHYDVNSLYPSVMENFSFPVGRVSVSKDNLTQETFIRMRNIIEDMGFYYFLSCTVDVPEMAYPPLPYRCEVSGKLLFPVGRFSGVWTKTEIEYAVKNCNCKILEIKKIIWWQKDYPVFKQFISKFKKIKLESEGAQRNFAKLIQNSLYGKLGMRRLRMVYQNYTEKKRKFLEEKNNVCAKIIVKKQDVLVYNKLFFADYIRPQFAAIVTALARVELLKAMHKLEAQQEDCVYYIDTDSIVTSQKMDEADVHEKEYGKWKIEREICEGVFVLPKVYAEKEKDGNYVLKSKGVIKAYAQKLNFDAYRQYYDYLSRGLNLEIYGENEKYYGRQKLFTALRQGSDPDKKILLRKTFLFSSSFLKRRYDFTNNLSYPINIQKLELERELLEKENYQKKEYREYRKMVKEEKKEFRKLILSMGGVNDKDYEVIPKWCKRKNGHTLDELVDEIQEAGYWCDGANYLHEMLLKI